MNSFNLKLQRATSTAAIVKGNDRIAQFGVHLVPLTPRQLVCISHHLKNHFKRLKRTEQNLSAYIVCNHCR